jgi:serine/threonine protein kinase
LKVLDFRLAKLTQPSSSSEHSALIRTEGTEARAVMSTISYMSPEQGRGQTANRRADIFTFGAILMKCWQENERFRSRPRRRR